MLAKSQHASKTWTYSILAMIVLAPVFSAGATILGALMFLIWLLFYRNFPLYIHSPVGRLTVASIAYFIVQTLLILRVGYAEQDLIAIFAFFQFLYLALMMPFLAHRMLPVSFLYIGRMATVITLVVFVLALIDVLRLQGQTVGFYFDIPWQEGQWWLGIKAHSRTSLLTGNPNTLATLLFPIIFLSMSGWREKHTGEKYLAIMAIVVGLVTTVFFAGNRISLVAAPIMLCLCVVYLWQVDKREAKLFADCVVLVFTVALGLLWLSRGDVTIARRVMGLLLEFSGDIGADNSVRQRILMLEASWQAFMHSPILGHGSQNKYTALIPFLQDSIMSHITERRTPHNIFATHIVAGGLVGLAVLLYLLVTPMLSAWRWLAHQGRVEMVFATGIVSLSLMTLGMAEAMFYNDQKNTLYLMLWFVCLCARPSENVLRT